MHTNTTGSGLSVIYATIPIVVSCDDFGQIHNGASYMEVSNSPSNGDYDIGLSLSGSDGSDWLFITLAKDFSADIFTKSINPISAATSLRHSNNMQNPEFGSLIFNNVSSVKIFDLQGKIIYEKQNIPENLSNSLNKELIKYHKGIYIIRLNYYNGEQSIYKFANLLE